MRRPSFHAPTGCFFAPGPPTRPFRRAARLAAALVAGLAPALIAPHAHPAAPETRATWVTTTGPDTIRSGLQTDAAMGRLAEIGLNTVYVEAWKNGFTQFASPTLDAFIGQDRAPALAGRDLLAESTATAHRHGLHHVAWFEYGFATQFVGAGGSPSNALSQAMRDRGWMLQRPDGGYDSTGGFAWSNPAVPEVRRFLIDLVLDAVETHDLDGIQFDDRLAWPQDLGWDDTTAALYKQETGRDLPGRVDDAHFAQWRRGKVTLFAQELSQAVRATRPDLHLSIAPAVTGFSDVVLNQSWDDWADQGLFDEYVPQVYRPSLFAVQRDLPAQINAVAPAPGDEPDDLVVGLLGRVAGNATPLDELLGMIELTRDAGTAGHSVFFSQTFLDDFGDAFEAFYDVAGQGPAPSPFFDPAHRPEPIAGTRPNPFIYDWTIHVPEAGRYRVIAEVNGLWVEVDAGFFEAGELPIRVPEATAVELLVDRRPLAADLSGDGFVGAADLDVMLRSWNQPVMPGAQLLGDLNRDGFVGAADLDLLLDQWNLGQPPAGVPAAGVAVPEPATLTLLLGVLAAHRRREPLSP